MTALKTRDKYHKVDKGSLREECERRGLPTSHSRAYTLSYKKQLLDRLRADDAIQRARRADADEDDVDPGDDEEPGGELPSGYNAAYGGKYKLYDEERERYDMVAVSAAEHYGLRDVRLRDVNAVEFVRLFEVKRASNDGDFTFLDQWERHLKDGVPLTTYDDPLERIDRSRAVLHPPPYPDEESLRLEVRRKRVVKLDDLCTPLARAAARWFRRWTGASSWDGRHGAPYESVDAAEARDTASSSLAKEIDEAITADPEKSRLASTDLSGVLPRARSDEPRANWNEAQGRTMERQGVKTVRDLALVNMGNMKLALASTLGEDTKNGRLTARRKLWNWKCAAARLLGVVVELDREKPPPLRKPAERTPAHQRALDVASRWVAHADAPDEKLATEYAEALAAIARRQLSKKSSGGDDGAEPSQKKKKRRR